MNEAIDATIAAIRAASRAGDTELLVELAETLDTYMLAREDEALAYFDRSR